MLVRIMVLFILFFILNACHAMHTTSEEENKNARAAKINLQLGMAYLERNELQRAKQKFLFALEEAPNNPEVWYSMAYFLQSTGNTAEANKYYLKSINLAPKRGDTLNNYGTFLCRTGDYRSAVSYFLKAVQDPKYLEPASAYENAGLCALKMKDTKNAERYFSQALREDNNRPNSLIELAELNYQQKNYALSRQQLKQYLQLASPNLQSYQLEQKLDEKVG